MPAWGRFPEALARSAGEPIPAPVSRVLVLVSAEDRSIILECWLTVDRGYQAGGGTPSASACSVRMAVGCTTSVL